MALTRLFIFLFLAAVLARLASSSASPFMSDIVYQASTGSTGRSLLQTENDCPISFEIQNYTILTSKCKAPYYPPLECCDAFKEFACPFAVYINNQSTNCGDTMFSYIIIRGYPKGLFADECLNGKEGVSCEGIPEIGTDVPSGGRLVQGVSSYLVLLLCGLGALLFL
uniref:Predicted protein n=1 Tax=Hordeum vulgare subsp. vulgare TaxID=112509 RepID=F2E210_HORVV|nr:predicted protein [Hordeum vulgare subsp. vulgare]